MDAADLRIFEAVARLGVMNQAAAELHTVQSNVTARVRLLEEELKTPLFHRHSRGVTLTSAGRRLLPYALRVQHLLEDARRAVQDDGAPRGPLTMGSLETTAAMRLPPILAAYTAVCPAVDLTLNTATTSELVEDVLQRRLDCAFVCGPVSHPALEEEVIFREELVIVTARAVRSFRELIAKGELKIVVLPPGCSYRQRLETILAKRGVVPVRRLDFGTIDGILGCVAAGLGVSLLPRRVVQPAWRAGQVAIHELPATESHVDTVVVRRRDALVSSALAAFLEEARRQASPRAPRPGRAHQPTR